MQDAKIEIMWKDEISAVAILKNRKVHVQYLTDDPVRCFLPKGPLNLYSLLCFLETRCPPRNRGNIQDTLKRYRIPACNPLDMCRITHGLMRNDYLWLRFDDEPVTYDDIRIRERQAAPETTWPGHKLTVSGITSEGLQEKFYHGGYWYKKNLLGDEATAEVLSSVLLSCSSLAPEEYVTYEECRIGTRRGCRSRDFLRPGESLVTLSRLYEQVSRQKLHERLWHLDTLEERAGYVLNFFLKYTGLDLKGYFQKIFTLDLLNLNEDRHFGNLAVIRRQDGTYRTAPIYDNGKSLFVGNTNVDPQAGFEENRRQALSRPFSADCENQFELFGKGFTVDFAACRQKMESLSNQIKNSTEFDIMMKNLAYTEKRHPELATSGYSVA